MRRGRRGVRGVRRRRLQLRALVLPARRAEARPRGGVELRARRGGLYLPRGHRPWRLRAAGVVPQPPALGDLLHERVRPHRGRGPRMARVPPDSLPDGNEDRGRRTRARAGQGLGVAVRGALQPLGRVPRRGGARPWLTGPSRSARPTGSSGCGAPTGPSRARWRVCAPGAR